MPPSRTYALDNQPTQTHLRALLFRVRDVLWHVRRLWVVLSTVDKTLTKTQLLANCEAGTYGNKVMVRQLIYDTEVELGKPCAIATSSPATYLLPFPAVNTVCKLTLPTHAFPSPLLLLAHV